MVADAGNIHGKQNKKKGGGKKPLKEWPEVGGPNPSEGKTANQIQVVVGK